MVQVLTHPATSPSPSATPTPSEASAAAASYFTRGVQSRMMTREEHAQRMKELAGRRPPLQTPRRSYSASERQAEHEHSQAQQAWATTNPTISVTSARQGHTDSDSCPPPDSPELKKPSAPLAEPTTMHESKPIPRRPALGGPRRSYSVTDHAPIPITYKPGCRLQLSDMPVEILHNIFDFLDDLDGTVLGLTSQLFYTLQRRRVGRVSLNLGRMGPNDLEWCWRTSGDLMRRMPKDLLRKTFPLRTATGSLAAIRKYQELSRYRLQGRQWCGICGASRCELHRHVRELFAEGQEFCEISEKYGSPAAEGAEASCSRRSPNRPNLCRRHHPKVKKVAEAAG